MNTAQLRQGKALIYGKNIVTNDYGEYKEELYLKGSCRYGILNRSQNRLFAQDELQFPQYKTLLVRHYVNVKAGDVMLLDDIKYDVVSVDENLYFHNKEIQLQEHNE